MQLQNSKVANQEVMPEKVLQFCRSNELVETFWIDDWNLDSIVGVAMTIHIYLSTLETWTLFPFPPIGSSSSGRMHLQKNCRHKSCLFHALFWIHFKDLQGTPLLPSTSPPQKTPEDTLLVTRKPRTRASLLKEQVYMSKKKVTIKLRKGYPPGN